MAASSHVSWTTNRGFSISNAKLKAVVIVNSDTAPTENESIDKYAMPAGSHPLKPKSFEPRSSTDHSDINYIYDMTHDIIKSSSQRGFRQLTTQIKKQS
jgi:hypothetical protein